MVFIEQYSVAKVGHPGLRAQQLGAVIHLHQHTGTETIANRARKMS